MKSGEQLRYWLVALWVVVTLGCEHPTLTSSTEAQTKVPATLDDRKNAGSDISLADHASPKEVANAALRAIEAQDKVALKNLVAVKKVQQDVNAIAQGRSKFQGMVDKAIPFAVATISSEINWLDVDGRAVDQESITGTTAQVTVKGTRAGKELTRRFFLVQEDGHWRLAPSHR